MLRNEKGFTFLEGILSFSLIFLVAAFLIPLLINMLSNVHEEKKEMVAYRLLYEQVEKQTFLGQNGSRKAHWNGVEFNMTVEWKQNGRWHACVAYEGEEYCIQ